MMTGKFHLTTLLGYLFKQPNGIANGRESILRRVQHSGLIGGRINGL